MSTPARRLTVGVLGATGRMGDLICRTVSDQDDLDLVARLGRHDRLEDLVAAGTQVAIDVTEPDAVMNHIRFAVDHGIHCVIGTSGVDDDRRQRIRSHLAGLADPPGVLVVPNFAIGAVLATRFAREAARFFAGVEIVEMHHAAKLDAPSGTAVAAAEQIAAARAAAGTGPGPDATTSAAPGSRGAAIDGIAVHAVRLPGMVAHLQVLLGNTGEVLTLRHDSLDRASFMPGVLAAVRAVPAMSGLVVGLESVLGV